MNENAFNKKIQNEPDLTFWKTTLLLSWILFKLTILASMVNQGAAEFIYAGF
mgnify:CR=1 FL=1|jgi:hypothetical protein